MRTQISRRHFLRLASSAAAIAAVSGCVPASDRLVSLIEPHVRPPEEALPSDPIWFASTCRECSAGCGIVVRTVNGRAKKIEGNPLHPLNHGKLCARGQAGLQQLYHPDRLQGAVEQVGGRGSRKFEPLQWDAAIEKLVEMVRMVSPNRIAFYGGLMADHLHFLVSRWLEAQGAPQPLMFDLHTELEGRSTSAVISRALFNSQALPVYDLANADVIYSFGANFLETWQSPVAYSHAYGDFRQGQAGRRGLLVQFEPRLSATAASADEWIPISPGTDGMVALALGRIIVEQGLGSVGSFGQDQASLYQSARVGDLAEASGVTSENLERLAHILANADRPVAVAGGYPAGHENGFDSHRAVQALNLILSRMGQRGGVYLSHETPTPALPAAPAPSSFRSVADLISKMKDSHIDLLFVSSANPVFDLPAASGFRDAIKKVSFVVNFSPFVDETAVWSDLILPDHTYLESWGYQVPSPGADRPVVSSQQPVVRPSYDTRSTADIILALAAEMGGEVAESLPWANEQLFLEDATGTLFGSSISAYGSDTAGEFWSDWRQFGGWWSEKELRLEPEPVGFGSSPLIMKEPTFHGDVESYPFHLYPYPSVALGAGHGANLPWLQELPDPMTTARWQTWVELNPRTAQELGLDNNDVVRVISPYGMIEAAVVIYPGIRPDVVAVPVGQGHTDYGRYASERGGNVADLLAPFTDPTTGALAWGATRVVVVPTGRTYQLARLESIEGDGRESLR